MIQAYYRYILAMNPLPWSNSVDVECRAAQFMAQEARPENPPPVSQPTSDLDQPCMESFCTNALAQVPDAQRQVDTLKEEVAKAEKSGNWLALSDYYEDFSVVLSTIISAEHAQNLTVNRLKTHIEEMEDLMTEWQKTEMLLTDAQKKVRKIIAEKEEEKKKKSSGSSSIQSQDEKEKDDVLSAFARIREEYNLTDAQCFEYFQEMGKKAQKDSQPSKSSEGQEDAEEDSDKSKAAD